MSILNVDKIQPIGGGSTITVDATDIQASTGTIRASTFSGDVSATGIGVTSLNITGVTTSAGIVQAAQFKLLDNAKAVYGSSADMEIYHNATNSLIQNGTGALQIITTTGDLFLRGQDNITFNTAGNNERLRITSSGNIGAGTNNPDGFYTHAKNLVIGSGSSGEGITIYSGTSDSGYIGFNDTASNSMQGFIQYNHNGDYMAFGPNGTEKVRIDSSGRLFVNRTAQHASSSERLSVNGMTSIQLNSTTTAGLYIFNEETTTSGNPVQPFIYLHDGSGLRSGLGVQRSTGKTIVSGQFGLSLRTGASGVGGTERVFITSNGKVNIGTGELDQTDRMLNIYGGRARISGITAGNSFEIYASNTSGQSYGILCQAGTGSSDINTALRNTSGVSLFRVRGDGVVFVGSSTVQQGSTSKLEVMGTLNNSYPGYSYPIMVSDDAAYNSSAGPGGGIGFSFKQNSGGAYAQAGGIRGIKENTTDGNYASALTFYTRPNGSGTTERLRISSDGYITAPNNVAFSARGGPADVTNNVIIFATIVFQRGGTNYDTSTGYFTAPVDGIYHFMCNPYRYTDSNDSAILLETSTDGGSNWSAQMEIRNMNDYLSDSGRGWFTLSLSQLIDLNKDDKVRIKAVNRVHTNGVYSRFSGFLVA